jgi:hypothetical protein
MLMQCFIDVSVSSYESSYYYIYFFLGKKPRFIDVSVSSYESSYYYIFFFWKKNLAPPPKKKQVRCFVDDDVIHVDGSVDAGFVNQFTVFTCT